MVVHRNVIENQCIRQNRIPIPVPCDPAYADLPSQALWFSQQINGVAELINAIVHQSAENAYHLDYVGAIPAEKLRIWYSCADSYLKSEPFDHMEMKYGYAVEELTNLTIQRGIPLPNGLRIALQATYGSTRPDIVIQDGITDWAWLDITNASSEGHIYSKASTKWNTIPYVAELLYPDFDKTMLHRGTGGIGGHILAHTISRNADMQKNARLTYMARCLDSALISIREYKPTEVIVLSAVESAFGMHFTTHTKQPAIKSMLQMYLFHPEYAMYTEHAEYLLNQCYKRIPQNITLARRYVSECYKREQARRASQS